MKRLYKVGLWVLLALSLISIRSIAQCTGDISLSTQAEVDSFPATYGCSQVIGSLTISGADITNLDSLYNISHVGQEESFSPFSLIISNNPLLADLRGLGSLKTVTKGVLIGGNPLLTNFNGFDSLTTVGGTVNTSGNTSLTSFHGMPMLESIGTYNNVAWVIDNCSALVNLKGFPLESLPGRFTISNNASLTSLKGLDSLKSITGSLFIVNNPVLTNTRALQSLTELGGPSAAETMLLIQGNAALKNLDGFSSLKRIAGGIDKTALVISGNATLKDLTGLSSLDSLNGFLQISSNPALKHLAGLGGLKSIGGSLEIRDNDALVRLTELSNLASLGATKTGANKESLIISGNRELKNLRGLESLTSLQGGLWITANDSLKDLGGLESMVSLGGTPYECCPQQLEGTVRITSNPSLRNIDALSNVTTIYHGVFIQNNQSLRNLDGLSSLAEIKVTGLAGTDPPARLEITDNVSLRNINGLSSLTSMEGDDVSITVTGNTALSHCCGLYPVLSNETEATVTISGNGAGCTREDILACGGAARGQQAAVYPNPTTGSITYEVTDDFFGGYTFGLYDLTNQLVQEQTLQKIDRSLKTQLDFGSMKKGLYVLKVRRSDGATFEKKLAVVE